MNVPGPRPGARSKAFPALLQRAGKAACLAADEFFAAQISNPPTRRAYARPVGRFLAWCQAQGIELCQVTPGRAGRFIEDLPGADPTRNLARALLGSLDRSNVVGLRDRALLGVLTYTGARVGALARRRHGDLQNQETQRVLRFREKGGKQREIPVRHDLDAGGIDLSPKAAPLFLAAERGGWG